MPAPQMRSPQSARARPDPLFDLPRIERPAPKPPTLQVPRRNAQPLFVLQHSGPLSDLFPASSPLACAARRSPAWQRLVAAGTKRVRPRAIQSPRPSPRASATFPTRRAPVEPPAPASATSRLGHLKFLQVPSHVQPSLPHRCHSERSSVVRLHDGGTQSRNLLLSA